MSQPLGQSAWGQALVLTGLDQDWKPLWHLVGWLDAITRGDYSEDLNETLRLLVSNGLIEADGTRLRRTPAAEERFGDLTWKSQEELDDLRVRLSEAELTLAEGYPDVISPWQLRQAKLWHSLNFWVRLPVEL